MLWCWITTINMFPLDKMFDLFKAWGIERFSLHLLWRLQVQSLKFHQLLSPRLFHCWSWGSCQNKTSSALTTYAKIQDYKSRDSRSSCVNKKKFNEKPKYFNVHVEDKKKTTISLLIIIWFASHSSSYSLSHSLSRFLSAPRNLTLSNKNECKWNNLRHLLRSPRIHVLDDTTKALPGVKSCFPVININNDYMTWLV